MARRVGSEQSATRTLILDTTEQLLIKEGYAVVSTRRVAAEAGLKPPLIHYYFPTTDDLFLAVYRRGAEQVYERLEEALACSHPLRALWDFVTDTERTTLAIELMALANHRKVIRDELVIYTERTRRRQVEALAPLLEEAGAESQAPPPLVAAVLMIGVARALVMESGVGITLGHPETRAYVEDWLAGLDGTDKQPPEAHTSE